MKIQANIIPDHANDLHDLDLSTPVSTGDTTPHNPPYDPQQDIRTLVSVLRHVIPVGEYVRLRGYREKGDPAQKQNIFRTFSIDLDPNDQQIVIDQFIQTCTKRGVASYVVPCGMPETGGATIKEMLSCGAIVLDIDNDPVSECLDQARDILGDPMLILQSGGITPAGANKLQCWWVLPEPARGTDIDLLRAVRDRVNNIVGGDLHLKNLVQPVRVVGSWHRKDPLNPRRCMVIEHNPTAKTIPLHDLGQGIFEMSLHFKNSILPPEQIANEPPAVQTPKQKQQKQTPNIKASFSAVQGTRDLKVKAAALINSDQMIEQGALGVDRSLFVAMVAGSMVKRVASGVLSENIALDTLQAFCNDRFAYPQTWDMTKIRGTWEPLLKREMASLDQLDQHAERKAELPPEQIANDHTVFQYLEPLLKDRLRTNDLTRLVEYRKDQGDWGELKDPVYRAWLRHVQGVAGMYKARIGMIMGGMDDLADRAHFDPIKAYLDQCLSIYSEHDRIDPSQFFQCYFGVADSLYSRMVSRSFLLGAVKRGICPGCKLDTMVILEGDEGNEKSSAIRTLAGAEWFREGLPNLNSSNITLALQGTWIIEMAELTGFNKADIERLREFITTRVDSHKIVYERFPRNFPRRAVLIGTTNEQSYIKDLGARHRRFLPVVTRSIDHVGIARDRERIWGSAYNDLLACEKVGFTWWGTQEERVAQSIQVADRVEQDPWEPLIITWLDNKDRSGNVDPITTPKILVECCGVDRERLNVPYGRRVASIMKKLGWSCERRKFKGHKQPVWIIPYTTDCPF